MAQGGNIWEWEETAGDLVNDSGGEDRRLRGGQWHSEGNILQSSVRTSTFAGATVSFIGFRVAGIVPEPSRALLSLLGLGVVVVARRR